MFLGNKDNEFTQQFKGTDYTLNYHVDSYPVPIINNTNYHDDFEILVPVYCNKIYVTVHKNNTEFKLLKATNYKIRQNPLNEKTICFLGDSICAASAQNTKGWSDIIQENNPLTNVYNYGHDGYTIAKAEDEWSNRSIQNVLDSILEEHPNSDYIIFQGGVNDYWGSSHGISLGEIASNYNSSSFDRETFSGGMEYIINYLYENFPNAKIGYIVTHQVYASEFYQFMDRAKEICKKWSIPYIDLFNEGNLNFQISYMRERYSRIDSSHPNGDGLHPNNDGYIIETPKIENWLKYKI